MSEMIERVAKAIGEYRSKPVPWDRCAPAYQVELRKQAKAAIEAMRHPTSDMCVKSGIPVVHGKAVWQDMIDAALKE